MSFRISLLATATIIVKGRKWLLFWGLELRERLNFLTMRFSSCNLIEISKIDDFYFEKKFLRYYRTDDMKIRFLNLKDNLVI